MKQDAELAARLHEKKTRQRVEHMEGGARNARLLLRALEHPLHPGEPIVADEVRQRCAAIIAGHDYWKLGKPHPAAGDPEALVCFEADALWPVHPLGVLADLERPGESGNPKDVNDSQEWRQQIRHNWRRCASTGRIGRGLVRYSRIPSPFSGLRRVTACIANGPVCGGCSWR